MSGRDLELRFPLFFHTSYLPAEKVRRGVTIYCVFFTYFWTRFGATTSIVFSPNFGQSMFRSSCAQKHATSYLSAEKVRRARKHTQHLPSEGSKAVGDSYSFGALNRARLRRASVRKVRHIPMNLAPSENATATIQE